MKITMLISSLGPGGAERVLTRLAVRLAETHRVTVLTFDDGSTPPFWELGGDVRHRPLGLARDSSSLGRGLLNNLTRIRGLRRALRVEQPDLLVSFVDQTNVIALIAASGTGIPVLVSERIDPHEYRLAPIWERLRRRVYPRAAGIVVQTERAREFFPPALRERVTVIPNPVARASGDAGGADADAHPRRRRRLLAMGRLTSQKGFDLLIDAFARLAAGCPDWELVIHGEGPERPALTERIVARGLEGRVRLAGICDTAGAAMRRADLFCLSSRFEGFPNVLCEAMAHGLPAVSFACPSGPGEIVRNGIDGLLVPPGDVAALSEALRELMHDAPRRAALGAEARRVVSRFGEESVIARWNRLFETIVEPRPA